MILSAMVKGFAYWDHTGKRSKRQSECNPVGTTARRDVCVIFRAATTTRCAPHNAP